MQILGIQLNTTGHITKDFSIAVMTKKTFAVSALIHWDKTHFLSHRGLLLLLLLVLFFFKVVFLDLCVYGLVSIEAFNTQLFLCCALNDATY
jgi:hypothetical protein